jgi:hypothetical protein
MADGKSEKETWLNYIVQLFARQFYVSISSVQVLAAKESHAYLALKNL